MKSHPYEIIGNAGQSRWLITCDHASNAVPASVNGGTLGLPEAEMKRHIAYDVGAAGVSRYLAEAMGATAILSKFSRLVIDPNRGNDDPTQMMRVYDGTIIPGNRHADAAEIQRRRHLFYDPYHAAYADLASKHDDTVIVAVHSFTPRLSGRNPRPWHVGILFAHDERLSKPLLDLLRDQKDLCVGANEPYLGHLPGDAVDQHALQHGRPNALLEIRQDLIEDETGQKEWAKRLAPVLEAALELSGV